MPFHIALVGNPNCGKTTFFNELTGSSQYVGNWPGVTVEKKEGKLLNKNTDAVVVDLPGIYSLSPYTPEEIVTRNYIMDENPDLIINIVDATNLERNLYLSTQLAELGYPMIIALNMMDMLKSRHIEIDLKKLEEMLGVSVFPISASKSIGTKELVHKAVHILHDIAHTELETLNYCDAEIKRADEIHMRLHASHPDLNENFKHFNSAFTDFYSPDVLTAISQIEMLLCKNNATDYKSLRFNAVKLFEDDPITEKLIENNEKLKADICRAKKLIELKPNVDRQMIIADQRYKFICSVCKAAVTRDEAKSSMFTFSDRIDRIVTNKFLAIPIFLAIMLLIFFITFGPIGSYLTDWVDKAVNETFANFVRNGLQELKVADFAVSLVCDGIIAGVGAVLSFFPQIMLLFFFLSILEDSGYMARAAFIMDKLLGKIGLSGKSFVPMIMGFGCSVPAILATRTLENEKDKRLTILITPFMSCSAKMPVYLLFASAFFKEKSPIVIFSLYLLGIVLAVLMSLVYKNTVLKGDRGVFLMELPPYRMPTLKSLWIHIWDKAKDFLTRAGTILLGASIIIWFLRSFDFSLHMVTDGSGSILESIGRFIAPIFKLQGFGFWQAAVALITGLAAKESIISTLWVLLGTATAGTGAIVSLFNGDSLAAYAFLVFVLLYTPCMGAVSAIFKEMNSAKWSFFAIFMQLFIAYIVSALVYQIGSLVI